MRDFQPVNTATHLRNAVLFNELGAEEIALLAKETREVRYDKGVTIFHRGDPCTGFHIVVFGQVKLSFISAQGAEKIVEVVHQGQSFGEAMMFLDKPYLVSAQALSNSLLLHVSKSAVVSEMERDHSSMRKMLLSLALRTYSLMLDVESYLLLSGKQRVIGYLLHLLESRERDEDIAWIDLSVKKSVIASRLNLTQEHFSRILHELADLGLMRVQGRRLLIPSLERLGKHQYELAIDPNTVPRRYGRS